MGKEEIHVDRASRVSLTILSHNRLEELQRLVPTALNEAASRGYEVVVVDNASTDGSASFLSALLASSGQHRLRLMRDNLGVAGGRNVAWSLSERQYIVSVDDDTRVPAQAIDGLIGFMDRHPDVGVAFPRIEGGYLKINQTPYGNSVCEPANFHGACHIIRRTAYEDVGPLDERCTFGGEELDYSLRMRAKGWRVVYVPDICVHHYSVGRDTKVAKSRRVNWVYNYVRILFKHFPVPMSVLFAWRLLVGHIFSGMRDRNLSVLFPLLWGAIQGVADGRRAHSPAPPDLIEFYRNPKLVPEFGNHPLWRKLWSLRGARPGR